MLVFTKEQNCLKEYTGYKVNKKIKRDIKKCVEKGGTKCYDPIAKS